MAKYKIKTKKTIRKFKGKIIDKRVDCYIYYPVLFGFIKLYVRITQSSKNENMFIVSYVPKIEEATVFTEDLAETTLKKLNENTNKFVVEFD